MKFVSSYGKPAIPAKNLDMIALCPKGSRDAFSLYSHRRYGYCHTFYEIQNVIWWIFRMECFYIDPWMLVWIFIPHSLLCVTEYLLKNHFGFI